MFDFFKHKKENEKTMVSLETFILNTISEFDKSPLRVEMLDGEAYYKNENTINKRVIYRNENGNQVIDDTKANNKLSHSFMKLLVDEKVGYFLGQEPTITTLNKNTTLEEYTNSILDEEFSDTLNDIALDASNKGIGWLHIYINEDSELCFLNIPSEQIIPLWSDLAHENMSALIRYYYVDYYEGVELKQVMKVEYWTDNTVMYYVLQDGMLIPDIEVNELGEHIGHFCMGNEQLGWGKIPYIPFKNNSYELNDLHFVKSLVDDYDLKTSDISNNLEEIQELIYVLKNYGGTELGQFMADLKYYKAIKVDDDGGVETIKSELDINSNESHLERLKRDFYHFGQGVDLDLDKLGNAPSGVALEFLYSKLKLKVDNMERKFKKSFKLLFYFITEYLTLTNVGIFNPRDLKVTFTRSVITNVLESINAVNEASTLISKKTALAHHPWVEDVEAEMEQIEEEEEAYTFNMENDDIDPLQSSTMDGESKEGEEE